MKVFPQLVVALIATTCLISCGSGSGSGSGNGNNDTAGASDDEPSVEPNAVRNIITLEDFTATIVGKQLVLMNEDGTRNPDSQIVINADMKVTGFVQVGNVDLDWYWDDEAWCRSGVGGLPNSAVTVELDCQAVDVDSDVVNFTRDRGQGELASSWFIE